MGKKENDIYKLPCGYKKIDLYSMGPKCYVATDVYSAFNVTYRVETKVKFLTVSSSYRQLHGVDYVPFWGCDKGKFTYTLSPSTGTAVEANIWYDIIAGSQKVSTTKIGQRILIFYCNAAERGAIGTNQPYQAYCAIRDYYIIYADDEMVAYYIPCEAPDGSMGMWECLSQKFSPLVIV